MWLLLLFSLYFSGLNAIIYDCYSGKPATRSQIEIFKRRNNTQYCLIDAKPCDPNEWRRVDGSCNSLDNPTRGMIKTPTARVLPPVFDKEYEPRKAKDGGKLPEPRVVRYQMLMEGKANDLHLTQMVTFYLLFTLLDINSIHDIYNYVSNTTNCCKPEGKSNYICAPSKIPVDDAVHRYSGVTCQNLTRPQSFQYFGCIDFGTTPFARITFATPTFDLSQCYGNKLNEINDMRTFKSGLIKEEIENRKAFPPSNPNVQDLSTNLCFLNQLSKGETRCHKYQTNGIVASTLFVLAFYRQHNYFAKELAKLNPCWDDERLFYTARDINIAVHEQIFYFELLPVLLGRKNMVKDGLISSFEGHRDPYTGTPPQISDEYVYVQRWFHTIQEADLKLYDKDGHYLRTFPMVNLTSRIGYLPLENNLEELYQCSFRQPAGRFDYTIHNDLAERVLGGILFAFDGSTAHISKGRYSGMQSYVKYREYCSKRSYKSFDSLRDVMSKERIYRLSELYDNLEDVDLLAGIWAEKLKPGSRLPETMYCLLAEQLKRSLESDRHWFERPNRPHAFTSKQLQAIRKVKVAGVLCINGDGVTKIQPNAFYKISHENPLTDCKSFKIGKVDLSAWKDCKCEKKE